MSKRRIELGRDGENIATSYLKENGFEIIKRNYRCLLGEIDIIAKDNEYLVFVEVRSRRGNYTKEALESVNWHKRLKVREVAQYYLHEIENDNFLIRFDVVAVIFKRAKTEIEYIKDAF